MMPWVHVQGVHVPAVSHGVWAVLPARACPDACMMPVRAESAAGAGQHPEGAR